MLWGKPRSGLYLRARCYDPATGVFTALDPFEGIMQRPMSMNGYSWVEGNTPNLTDPSGKSPALAATLNDGVCQAQNQECSRTHIVQSGETLNSIANRYEIESLELAIANGITNPTLISPDLVLCIPGQPIFATNTPRPRPLIFETNTPRPSTAPTATSTPTPTSTTTPTPSATPISLSSVFGNQIAIPLPGATTAVYGAGHAAIDIVPQGRSNAAGAAVYAVCSGEVRHKNKAGFGDNPYYNNVVELICTNPNRLIIYSHVCPSEQLRNTVTSGSLLGTLAGLNDGDGECVDNGNIFPFFGAAHLHFEGEDLSSGEAVPPSIYLSECQSSNPPSWCAVASDFNQSSLPTSTPSP